MIYAILSALGILAAAKFGYAVFDFILTELENESAIEIEEEL